MADAERPAVLFLDFDNTVTQGDVLDAVIERFSPGDEWRRHEEEWQAGRLGTVECLQRQMDGLRASREELMAFLAQVRIDPDFPRLMDWAARNGVMLRIVSDNFAPLIAEILALHRIAGISVFANELSFADGRVEARFPLRDPLCTRCAHCKAQHLRALAGRQRVYVGDGLSDICPALIADRVFAKDSLARELARRGVAFEPFSSLGEVLGALDGRIGSPLVA